MTGTLTDFPDVMTKPGLSGAAVEAIADFCEEQGWLRERRLAAWQRYESIPMPSRRDERWRFTNLRGIRFEDLVPFTGCDEHEAAFERAASGLTGSPEFAARFVSANNALFDAGISRPALPEGVIACTMYEAARDHEELLRTHLGSVVAAGESVDDKFVALNEALSPGGVFVYVPRGVKVDLPIEYVIVHAADKATISPRALVVLEEQAEATFVEEYLSVDGTHSAFSNAVVELVVGAGAKLNYTTAQDYALPVAHFATHRVVAARDSQVEWTAIGLGASRGKSRMEVRLAGPGANVRLNGAYFLDGTQELDYDTQQVHDAPNAFSDLAFKGVLADQAHSVWRGIIDVRPGAQGTDSYQENRNLLLNSGAHADSIPGLQIEANEVRCTHGATISKVDAEQLFYLQARGIPRDEAVKTIVRGFFTPLLDRIHPEPVRDAIREALWQRMDRRVG